MKVSYNYRNNLIKVQEFCSKYLIIIVSIIILIIGIYSFFKTAYFDTTFDNQVEKTSYKSDNIFINILLMSISLLFIFFICKLIKKCKIKYILNSILIIIFIVQTIWVLHLKYESAADQKCIINCAECIMNKDFATVMENNGYLNKYPFLIGIVYYIEFVYKLLNTNNELVLQFLNVIYSTINILLMYKITQQLFKNKYVQNISLILLTGFSLYFLFFNPHVYGNIIGMTFGLIALLYVIKYLENKKILNLVICGFSITLSIILKSNYNIFLCAIMITLIFEYIKNTKVKTIFGTIGILLIYIIIQEGLTVYTENKTGYNQNTGVPMISYIYMGMAESNGFSSGWYTGDTLRIYEENNFDTERGAKQAIKLIKERIKEFKEQPQMAINFYKDKLASTWLNPTYQTVWCSIPGIRLEWNPEYKNYLSNKKVILSMLSGKLYKIEETYFNIYQIIIYLFAFVGMLNVCKKKKIKYIIIPLIFLGGFLFHILWETKSIYVLQYYFLLIPYSSWGLYLIWKEIRNFKIHYFNKHKKLLNYKN